MGELRNSILAIVQLSLIPKFLNSLIALASHLVFAEVLR
jgi:hypothetical protein